MTAEADPLPGPSTDGPFPRHPAGTSADPDTGEPVSTDPTRPMPVVTVVLVARDAVDSAGTPPGEDADNQQAASPTTPPATSAAAESSVSPTAADSLGPSGLEVRCAAALGQTRPPERLLVLDLTTNGAATNTLADQTASAPEPTVHTHRPDADPAQALDLSTALDAALAELPPVEGSDSEEWLWLLPDDTIPDDTALAQLVDAIRRSPSVGIAGPKIVEHEQPKRLVEVGLVLTRTGRRVLSPTPGEPDQGQYDTRTDVLAVGLPGMLIRRGLIDRIGGLATPLGPAAQALDVGWRAQLAGERVVVVPAARVHQSGTRDVAAGTGSRSGLASRIEARVAARRVALARCAPLAAPVLAGWIVVSSILGALALLLLKRPAHAWVELSDGRALLHPVSSAIARRRFRKHRKLRRRDLRTLFVSSGDSARHTLDRILDAVTPDRSRARDTDPLAAVESGPVSEEAEDLSVLPTALPQRIVTNPGVLATVAAAIVGVIGLAQSLRSGLADARGSGVVSNELARVSTDATGLWHAYHDGWHGAGLGSPDPSGPHLAVLAALTWLIEHLPYVADGRSPASVAFAWILLTGMPLAAVSAYLAGRVITLARWPRGLAAFAWGTSVVLAGAIGQGRVTVVLAHVLLPLVASGLVRVGRSSGTFTAAAATALGAAVLGALVPVLLVPVALTAVVLAVVAPGLAYRARALVVLVVPVALQGPALYQLRWLPQLLGSPGAVASTATGSSTTATTDSVPTWSLALGHPDGITAFMVFDWPVPPQLVAALTAPVLGAAVLALVRGSDSRAAVAARGAIVALALVGLGYALMAPRLVLGSARGSTGDLTPVTPWSGIGVQLYVFAVLALALSGTVGMRGILGRGRARWRQAAAAAGLGVVTLAVFASAVGLAIAGLDRDAEAAQTARATGVGGAVSTAVPPLPAVAVDQADSEDASRLLVLTPEPERITYQIMGAEPGLFLRSVLPAGPDGSPTVASVDGVTDPGFAPLVTDLAAGTDPGSGSTGARLAALGVGFVSVQDVTSDTEDVTSDPEDVTSDTEDVTSDTEDVTSDTEPETESDTVFDSASGAAASADTSDRSHRDLVRILDASPGMTRLGTTDGQTLWRVQARDAARPSDEGSGPLSPVTPSRVWLATADGTPIQQVPVLGSHGATDTELPAGRSDRRLVVAESPDWASHALVSVDGVTLEPIDGHTTGSGTTVPTYLVPEDGGRLTIEVPARQPWIMTLQLALLAVVVFLAIPFGNRRSRRFR